MSKRRSNTENPRFLESPKTRKGIPALEKRKKKTKAQKLARRKNRSK